MIRMRFLFVLALTAAALPAIAQPPTPSAGAGVVYTDLMNLNDSLLRYYQGVTDRVLQEEHYHWWMNFGVKVEF